MNYGKFVCKYITPFKEVRHIFSENDGYIVWREGTGNNIELLHIRAFKQGQGIGTALVKAMLIVLKKNPPYYSVFGFGLWDNKPPQKLYKKLGFNIVKISGPYKGGAAFFMWQDYKKLCKKLSL